MYVCFIELQKAYDSVNRELLWKVLTRFDVSSKIIRNFHDGMRARVPSDDGEHSEWFGITQGLRQGCVLQLTLPWGRYLLGLTSIASCCRSLRES